MKKLAIIIPTFNRKDLLSTLLKSLENQTISWLKYEIVVVVDGSTDGTLEMIQNQFFFVKVVRGNGNWWWTRSINEGLKWAIQNGFDLFLLMNDDTFVKSNFLDGIIKHYFHQGGGILGAINITSNVPYRIFFSGIKSVNWYTAKLKKYHKFLKEYASINNKNVKKSIFLPGRGMLFNREVIKTIGFFNEQSFPQYYADYDFSYRAFKFGFPVNISWEYPIYSYINLTGKGSKTNSSFKEFLISIRNPMSPNSFSKTVNFYQIHAGKIAYVSIFMHYLRKTLSFLFFCIKRYLV